MTAPLPTPDEFAEMFHETYERLAPQYGYMTRPESRTPWANVPDKNRELMIATCAEILARLRPAFEAERQDAPAFHPSTDIARDALSRLVNGAWRGGKHDRAESCFSIPVNRERDADCILSDVITERDALRANLANRHYVCEAHVPLGEPGNYDDKCPCCEAVKLADDLARKDEALRACVEALRMAVPILEAAKAVVVKARNLGVPVETAIEDLESIAATGRAALARAQEAK